MTMSAAARQPWPEPTEDREPRRLLRSLPRPTRSRPRVLYAAVAVAGISAVAVCQLLLSIGTSEGAYEIAALQQSQRELARTAQTVGEDLDRVTSSQYLAANAEALGMVRNASPVYLRLSDGAVLGAPVPAAASAGTVLGGAGDQVPNALLAGVPLVTQQDAPAAPSGSTIGVPAAPTLATETGAGPDVALPGGIPAPATR